MAKYYHLRVKVNEKALEDKVQKLFDDKTMLEVHNFIAKMCDPYVPMLNGPLHESGLAQVTADSITYGNQSVPYARYQYYGVNFNHTVEFHPLATALWDKVMMQDREEEVLKGITQILERRAKELYG